MFIRHLAVRNFFFLFILFYNSNSMAQTQEETSAKVERLFDNFLRRAELPLEFTVSVYRTTATGVGPYLGTIVVRNSVVTIAGRNEPALILKPNLEKLTPGPHAFHIHENPDCGPKAKDGVMVPGLAAGAHLFAE